MKERTIHIVQQFLVRHPELSVVESPLLKASGRLIACFTSGGKLLVCGNGGSAADAEHIVGELMKGFLLQRPVPEEHRNQFAAALGEEGETLVRNLQGALPAISLVSQTSLASAIANDTSAEMIYAQQVYGYGKPGDALIGISTSGNAGNVIKAFQAGRALGMQTISFTGETGGRLSEISDISIRVPSDSTPEIQEFHVQVYHLLCSMIESEYFDE